MADRGDQARESLQFDAHAAQGHLIHCKVSSIMGQAAQAQTSTTDDRDPPPHSVVLCSRPRVCVWVCVLQVRLLFQWMIHSAPLRQLPGGAWVKHCIG